MAHKPWPEQPEPATAGRWSDRPVALWLLVGLLGALSAALWLAGASAGRSAAGRLALGLAAGLVIARTARQRGWLTAGGALGAVLTGALVVAGGGLTWGALLIVFFLSSTLLSRWRRRQKALLAVSAAKGARRDLGQVLANGGIAALLALVAAVWPAPLIAAAYIGALAAVTADTWSSEVGSLSRQPPRLITTGRAVPPGANGGVTLLGTLASAAGGLLIGSAALLLAPIAVALGEPTVAPDQSGWLLALGLLAGAGGSLVDSVLGATVQGVRWCPACRLETEAARHTCGAATRHGRGWPWLDNDRVNLLAALAGALIAAALWAGQV